MKLIPNLREIDRQAIQLGIPATVLMENAGARIAEAVMAEMSPDKEGMILCGPGNNGGDGFACAQILSRARFHRITVIHTTSRYQNEANIYFDALQHLPIRQINAQTQLKECLYTLENADFIVDALFGSGLNRPIRAPESELITALNHRRTQSPPPWILAVDLPSGIDGATGQRRGAAVQADATVTFATAKPGLYLFPGKMHAGHIVIADIGIPASLVTADPSPTRLLDKETAQACLPPRPADGNKFTFGHVLILAGSLEMPGAAILCAEAAMSAGSGLVTLAAPQAVFSACPLMPEIMRFPLPDREFLTPSGANAFVERLRQGKYNAILLGPGLGRRPDTVIAITQLLQRFSKDEDPSFALPIIVDADALYALSRTRMPLNRHFVLTPHAGECARLMQEESASINADILQAAQATQQHYQSLIVLKSAATIVALPCQSEEGKTSETQPQPIATNPFPKEESQWISPLGNPGMATAGSGDVLAGILAAIASQCHAQNLPLPQAVLAGVYLHGFAGDSAAEALTSHAMRSSDITRHVPQAFKTLITSLFE